MKPLIIDNNSYNAQRLRPINNIEPWSVKYYLMNYRMNNKKEFIEKYGNISLQHLSMDDLMEYFKFCALKDLKKLELIKEDDDIPYIFKIPTRIRNFLYQSKYDNASSKRQYHQT